MPWTDDSADDVTPAQIEFFRREAGREHKLLATIVGHEHDVRTEEVENHRQFVLPFNGNGSYTDIHLLPLK